MRRPGLRLWESLAGVAMGLLLALIVVVATAPWWLSGHKAGPVSKAIGKEIRYGGNAPIEIRRVTPFPWDEMYLFGPYQPRALVCEHLQLADEACDRHVSIESIDDGDMSLVFRHRGQVAHSEIHHRGNGDFLPLPVNQPLTPETAVFDVVEQGITLGWHLLVLRASARVGLLTTSRP